MEEPTSQDQAIRLRGHMLLCLQGFRGKGYSEDFVQNLVRIHKELAENPQLFIEVVESPDDVCQACPHLSPSGCMMKGETSEQEMQAQDRHVLSLLELKSGSRVSWSEILKRIQASIKGSDLPSICGQCPWLPLGYCREGIDGLHRDRQMSGGLIKIAR